MYKYKKGLLPLSFDHAFTELGSTHKYDTRNRNNYRHEVHKIKSVFDTGPKLWNKLPESIKNVASLNCFKKTISDFVKIDC